MPVGDRATQWLPIYDVGTARGSLRLRYNHLHSAITAAVAGVIRDGKIGCFRQWQNPLCNWRQRDASARSRSLGDPLVVPRLARSITMDRVTKLTDRFDRALL